MSRVSVVTGGTSGIGRGIVEKLLENSQEGDSYFCHLCTSSKKGKRILGQFKTGRSGKADHLKSRYVLL